MIKNKIAFAFVFVFLLASVSAVLDFRDYTSKWNLCTALNLTQASCDTYWENISNFGTSINQSFNATEQGYIFGVLNGTYMLNQTLNESLQAAWLGIHNGTYVLNATNTTNSSGTLTAEQVRDLILAYNKQPTTNQTIPVPYQQPTSSNTGLYIVLIIAVAIIILALIYWNKKKTIAINYPSNNSQYSGNPQDGSSDMSAIDKFVKSQDRYIKERAEKKSKKKSKKKGEEEDDDYDD